MAGHALRHSRDAPAEAVFCYNARLAGRTVVNAGGRIQRLLTPWIILANFIQKMYIQRGLIRSFVVRDLKQRYIGSLMGFFWSVIHPIVLIVSYTFVFLLVFHIKPLPETGTTSFPLFLFCSILPWLFFQDTLQRSSTVLIDNANLVTKTIFPTEILPLSVMLAALVNHLIGFAILLAVILFSGGKISVFILMVPLYFLALMAFTLGLAWMVASLNVFMRDIAQVVNVVLTFWFWFTPIFYTPNPSLSPWIVSLLKCNPLSYVVVAYRDCLLRMQMPNLGSLALLAALSLAVFAAGGLFFRHIKREFVDVL